MKTSILVLISTLLPTFAAHATTPLTRDAITKVTPVGTTYATTEQILKNSGYVADGDLAIVTTTDASRQGFESVQATAHFVAAPHVAFVDVQRVLTSNGCLNCHSAGSRTGVVLDSFANVKAVLPRIQTAVLVNKTMPPQGPVSAADALVLSNWILVNAPERTLATAPAAGETVTITLQGSRDLSAATPTVAVDQMSVQHSL